MTQNVKIDSILKAFGNLKWWQATIMIVLILGAAGFAAHEGANVSVSADFQVQIQKIEDRMDIPVNSTLSAFQKSNTYIVTQHDQGAALMNSSGYLNEFLANESQVISDGLNNASILGGSVYVQASSYSAAVIVPNDTRFIIETGATGISYNVASGASCIIEDFQNSLFAYYQAGSVWSVFNYGSGTLLVQSTNMTTLYVSNITGLTGNVRIFKLVLENGTQFPSNPPSGYLFDCNNTAYYYNGTQWIAWGTGIGSGTTDYNQLTNKPDLTQFVATNGTRPLTSNWNINQGIYGAQFINATAIYATMIDQLTSGQGVRILDMIVQSGTSFPASPIDRQEFYRSDLGYEYIYNSTGSTWLPVGYTPNSYPYANLTGVPQTFPYGNLTGYPDSLPWNNLTSVPVLLFANGAQGLTADWNVGGTYGIYGASWINSTSLNVSGTGYFGNITSTQPMSAFSYMVYVDPTNSNLYDAKAQNGTICWSSTNTTAVITNAIGNTTRGTVILGPGNFSNVIGVQMQSNVRVLGSGINVTIVSGGAGPNAEPRAIFRYLSTTVPLVNFDLGCMTIDGTNMNHTSYSTGFKAVSAQYVNDSCFHDLFIYNTPATGLGIDYLSNCKIEGVTCAYCGTPNATNYASGAAVGSNGIGLGTSAYVTEQTIVSDCISYNCADAGFCLEDVATASPNNSACYIFDSCQSYNNLFGYAVKGQRNVIISNSHSWNDTLKGIYLWQWGFGNNHITLSNDQVCNGSTVAGIFIDNYNESDITITGCTVSWNYGYGIYTLADNIMISSSRIDNNNETGIFIVPYYSSPTTTGISIEDNMIYDNGYGGVASYNNGIRVAGNTGSIDNVRISSNSIFDDKASHTQTYGLLIVGNVSDLQIYGNNYQNDVTSDIYFSSYTGSNCMINDAAMNPTNLGNLSYIGTPSRVTVQQTVKFGDLLFCNSTGYFLANATSSSTMLVCAIAVQPATAGSTCEVLQQGYVCLSTWSWTVGSGNPIYASASTLGAMTQSYPSGTSNIDQWVATPISPTVIEFNPSSGWVTHS